MQMKNIIRPSVGADLSALIRINLRTYPSPSVGARTNGTLSDDDSAAGVAILSC